MFLSVFARSVNKFAAVDVNKYICIGGQVLVNNNLFSRRKDMPNVQGRHFSQQGIFGIICHKNKVYMQFHIDQSCHGSGG
jgi:hypothetical protein